MLNRPQNAYTEVDPRGEPVWDVDERPAARLRWLLAFMAFPLVVIGGRLAWVQCRLTEAYVDAFTVSSVSYETIPARDGRILSADGRILADDLQQFDVRAQYRWIETPANGAWLKQQALARLGREDKQDKTLLKEKLRAAQDDVLGQRDRMWRRLAEISATDVARLDDARAAVQQRVERIVASIEWKRHEEQWAGEHGVVLAAPTDVSGWWSRVWQTAAIELTTPPHRESKDPLVIQEELQYHRVIENVPLRVAAEIQAHPEEFPGLKVETSGMRIYPQKALAPHVVGHRGPIDDDEMAARKERFPQGDPLDYESGDRIGKSGVERRYDRELRGVRGLKKIVRNRRGEVTSTEMVREARVGRDVVLTLNLELQQRLEALLDKTLAAGAEAADDSDDAAAAAKRSAGACLVAIDVHTGAVLAAASAPRYDLDLLVHPDATRWKALTDDPRRPFFDRATQMALPPGSVFKALTAVAFLESGKIDPDAKINCAGYLDSPNRHRCYIFSHFGVGHGETDMADALAQSCNVYFYVGARKTGPWPLVTWAERFGFGQPTGIDLPSEQSGHLPRPPADGEASERGAMRRDAPANTGGREAPQKKWQPGDTLGLAIGQSRLLATPMQIARLMAAIANDGRLVTPHVVRPDALRHTASEADVDVDDEAAESDGSLEPRPIPGLRDGTLARVREGLEKVVADRRGTGYKSVRLKEVAIAGKTGTAEVGGGKPDHAWFAGYLPADRPRIAFAVVLEHGGAGGRAAGPVAKEFARALLDLGLVTSHTEPAEH